MFLNLSVEVSACPSQLINCATLLQACLSSEGAERELAVCLAL